MVDFMLQAATKQTVAFDYPFLAVKVGVAHHGVFFATDRDGNAGA